MANNKDLTFQEDSTSIIKGIVEKYHLKINDNKANERFSPEELAGGELAQAARDIVKGRYSLKECANKFQEIFNISSEEASEIVEELNSQVIAKATPAESNEGASTPDEPLTRKKTLNKESELLKKNDKQDLYREQIK